MYVGSVQRRCIADDQWKEFIECFRVETKVLLDEVITIIY